MATRLHPLPALLATLALGACSTAPTMPEKAWKISPVQTVRHGGSVRADGYYALGRAREGQGAYAKAMDAYRKAIDADPGYVAAWNALGVLQVQTGAGEEGVRTIEHAISLSPTASHLYNNLGYALMLAKRHETAAVALQRAVELDPDNRRAWRNLATLWENLGNAEQAAFADAKATGAPLPPTALSRDSENPAIAAPLSASTVAIATPVSEALDTRPAEMKPLPTPTTQAETRITVEHAPPAPAPTVHTAPEAVLIKVAENVFELRNAPVTRAETLAEAADIITTTTTTATASRVTDAQNKAVETSAQAEPSAPVRVARYEITNGQGGEGLARRLAAMLGKDGFKRPRLTNHTDYNQAVSYVEYREGYREQATAFAERLPFRPALRPAEAPLLVDVRLMLGKDLNTADACEVLGLCATYARNAAPRHAEALAPQPSLTPVSEGAVQRKRPPPDRI